MSYSLENLRSAIARAIGENNLILFIGAGISKCAGLPLWGELLGQSGIQDDLEKIQGGLDSPDLTLQAQIWELEHSRRELMDRIRPILDVADAPRRVATSAVHQVLNQMHPRAVITTNFDPLLTSTFQDRHPQVLAGDAASSALQGHRFPILHVHGHIDQPDSIILTRNDFRAFTRDHQAVCQLFSRWLQDHTCLFLGYGGADGDLQQLIEVQRGIHGRLSRSHYALVIGEENASVRAEYDSGFQAHCCFLPLPPGGDRAQFLADTLQSLVPASQQVVAMVQQARIRSGDPLLLGFPRDFQLQTLHTQNIPVLRHEFIGRQAPKSQLTQALAGSMEAGRRIVTIVSLRAQGGLGKTTLAAAYASEALKHAQTADKDESPQVNPFPDGVIWHRVGRLPFAESVAEMLRACGHRAIQELSLDAKKAWLRHSLAGRQVLIVLDNVDDVDLAPPLLDLLQDHAVLITSRHDIEGAIPIPLDRMEAKEAVDLFRSRHRLITTSDTEQIRHIVMDQLHGVPLAIVLAATVSLEKRLTLDELSRRLKEKGLAAIDRRGRPGTAGVEQKDLSVRSSFEVSWDFVTCPQQRLVFAFCTLFGGQDFPRSALLQLVSEIFKKQPEWNEDGLGKALDGLVTLGLIERTPNSRFALWPLLREFAQEELDASLRQPGAAGLTPSNLPLSREQLDSIQVEVTLSMISGDAEYAVLDQAHIEAMLKRLESPALAESFFSMLLAVERKWWQGGCWSTRLHWLRRGEFLAQKLPNDVEKARSWELRCLKEIVDCLAREGQSEEALQMSEQARQAALDLRNRDEVVSQDFRAGSRLFDLGRPDDAWGYFAEGLRSGYGGAWHGTAAIHHILGGLLQGSSANESEACFQFALRWERPRIKFNTLLILAYQAEDHLNRQQWDQTKTCLQEMEALPDIGEEGASHLARTVARQAQARQDFKTSQCQLAKAMSHSEKTKSLAETAYCHHAYAHHFLAEAHAQAKAPGEEFNRHLAEAEVAAAVTQNLPDQFECLLLRVEARLLPLTQVPSKEAQRELRALLLEANDLLPSIAHPLPKLRYGLLRGLAAKLRGQLSEATQWLYWAQTNRERTGLCPLEHQRLEEALAHGLAIANQAPADAPELLPALLRYWQEWQQISPRGAFTDTSAQNAGSMVFIPAGIYRMFESFDDQPLQAYVPAFLIDERPVTQRQYAAFCVATGREIPSTWQHREGTTVEEWTANPRTYPPGTDAHPITSIPLEDARAYADWCGKQLPTETEWRAAIQGPELRPYPWGESWQDGLLPPVEKLRLHVHDFHPLCQFDEAELQRLLEGSLSLSVSEKLRVIDALPTLTQFQIDELFEVFRAEIVEIEKQRPEQATAIATTERLREAERAWYGRIAPLPTGQAATASWRGVLDGYSGCLEWIDAGFGEGKAIGIITGSDYPKCTLTQTPTQDHDGTKPDPTIGFRCAIPLLRPDRSLLQRFRPA